MEIAVIWLFHLQGYPQYRRQNIMILIMWTQRMTPKFEKSPNSQRASTSKRLPGQAGASFFNGEGVLTRYVSTWDLQSQRSTWWSLLWGYGMAIVRRNPNPATLIVKHVFAVSC